MGLAPTGLYRVGAAFYNTQSIFFWKQTMYSELIRSGRSSSEISSQKEKKKKKIKNCPNDYVLEAINFHVCLTSWEHHSNLKLFPFYLYFSLQNNLHNMQVHGGKKFSNHEVERGTY